MEPLLNHHGLTAFIQAQAMTGAWLASVCSGAFVLGKAGVLDKMSATTYFGGETSLQAQFLAIKVIHDQAIVVDNRRLTANGGLVSYQAALVLVAKLMGLAKAKQVYDSLGHARLRNGLELSKTIGFEANG